VWLRRIEADRLRNLKAVALDLSAGMTVFCGRNGQGKSSLLEAIYRLGTTRSCRTRKLAELTAWSGGPLRVAGSVDSRSGSRELTVIHDGGERAHLLDGTPRELEDYLGALDVIDLTAEREAVLRGAPDERRRFLDRGLVGLHPSWLTSMAEYRRAIGHRNALLRRLGPRPGAAGLRELEAWDERLVSAASRIHAERRRYAVELGARLGAAGRVLFPDDQDLVLRYLPSPARSRDEDPERFADVFLAELRRGRERDLGLGFTHTGPHRDDLTVELDDVDLRTYGSAGQLRAALVVLKLAKLALLKEEREEAPVFLMDDYDTDLDEERARSLAAHLHEGGFQAIVATSKDALVERLGVPVRVVRVRGGEIDAGA
jgi:DNA replication and repair protein RecF